MAKKKNNNKRCYICRKCNEVTALGKGTRNGKVVPMAPEFCGACGHDDLCSQPLHPALPEGMHLVPCPGEAHQNEAHADNCGVCAPRWGRIMIPKKYPTHAAYSEAEGGGVRIVVMR